MTSSLATTSVFEYSAPKYVSSNNGPGYESIEANKALDIILLPGNQTSLNGTLEETNNNPGELVALPEIVGLSLVFCIIGLLGIIGNSLVILIILSDRKMRRSVTNLFIMNLAVSDLLIMLFGIPEIVMFMLNRGWLLGWVMCKLERYALVFSLYSSVITQVSVCVER